jgi:hypothetical protein
MLIYVAGKYSGDVQANIEKAEQVAGALWHKGHAVIGLLLRRGAWGR